MKLVNWTILFVVMVLAANRGFCAVDSNDCKAEAKLRTMRYTHRSAEEAAAWQKDLRAKLFTLLKLDDLMAKEPIPLEPNEIAVLYSDPNGKYIAKEIEISSTPGRRIRIVVTIPTCGKGPFPAVVCIGGHCSDRYSPYDKNVKGKIEKRTAYTDIDVIYKEFGSRLAELGVVTISTDVSRHEVYESGRILMGERLWDVIRCVDFLESMAEVDKSRIGCGGLSLGGEMSMWLGAMDTRIAAAVSCGFLTTMDHMEKNHCMCWKFDGLRELVDYADIFALTAPHALQCQNGVKEPETQFNVVLARKAMEEVRLIYVDMDRPENVVLDIHEGEHEVDWPGLKYFLGKHLGFEK